MREISVLVLVLAGLLLNMVQVFGQSTMNSVYTAPMANGSTWIGKKSPHMPLGAVKLSGHGSLEIVPIHVESNYDRFIRKAKPIQLITADNRRVLTGTWKGNAPPSWVSELPEEGYKSSTDEARTPQNFRATDEDLELQRAAAKTIVNLNNYADSITDPQIAPQVRKTVNTIIQVYETLRVTDPDTAYKKLALLASEFRLGLQARNLWSMPGITR